MPCRGTGLARANRLKNALRLCAIFVNLWICHLNYSVSRAKLALSYIPETVFSISYKILHLCLVNDSESKLVGLTFPLFWFSNRAFQGFLKPDKGSIKILWKNVILSHRLSNYAVMIISSVRTQIDFRCCGMTQQKNFWTNSLWRFHKRFYSSMKNIQNVYVRSEPNTQQSAHVYMVHPFLVIVSSPLREHAGHW